MSGCRPPQATSGGRRFPQGHPILGVHRARFSTCYPQIMWMCVGQKRLQQQLTPARHAAFTEYWAFSTACWRSSTGSSTGFAQPGSAGCCRGGCRWYDTGLASDLCSGLLPVVPPTLSTGGPEEIPRVSLWSSTAAMDHDRLRSTRRAGPRRNVGTKTSRSLVDHGTAGTTVGQESRGRT